MSRLDQKTAAENKRSEPIPRSLKPLAGTPEKVLGKLFAKPLKNPVARDLLAGLVSGMGVDLGQNVPEWAANASRRFLESCRMDFAGKSADEITPNLVGKLVGLWESPAFDKGRPHKIKGALDAFCKQAKIAVNDDPPAVARDFHSGRVEAAKIDDAMNGLPQRAKIFLLIFMHWRKVAELKSTTELWQWLLSLEDNGQKLIAPATDSREIRAVCQLIGLRYQTRAGRPRKLP